MAQPEARLSREIMKKIRSRGGYAVKIHGGPCQQAGLPDICIVWHGLSLWVETKCYGNTTTPIQDLVHSKIRAAGGHVLVAYSVKEVEEWLSTFE